MQSVYEKCHKALLNGFSFTSCGNRLLFSFVEALNNTIKFERDKVNLKAEFNEVIKELCLY